MKFKSKETKYLQFGRDTIKLEKGKTYDTEKDFDDKFVQSIKYIIKMNSKLFRIIKEHKKTQEPVEEPVQETETIEEEETTENTEESTETSTTETITKSELDNMTKSELLELQEKYNLDVSSSNLKQEIYEQVETYLMENDLLVD